MSLAWYQLKWNIVPFTSKCTLQHTLLGGVLLNCILLIYIQIQDFLVQFPGTGRHSVQRAQCLPSMRNLS